MPATRELVNLRLFAALRLTPALLSEIQVVQNALKQAVPARAVRWTTPEQWHLTLKFFGNVPSVELAPLEAALERAGQGFAPFQLFVEGAGCFPSPQRPSVIWLGIGGAVSDLRRLQTNVERECAIFGSHKETRDFHPHITLGRVKAFGAELRRVGGGLATFPVSCLGGWPVAEIELMQSRLAPQGSTYSVVASAKLRAI